MKSLRSLLLGSVAALCLTVAAKAESWTEDYSAALAQAKATNKVILLDFTGSDWCSWCKKIDKEVFATDTFKAYADQNLILVKLDFPHEKPQDDKIKAQNKGLAEKYGVEGFPTLIAIDGNEKVLFAQTGYEPGGAEPFIKKFPAKN